LLLDRQEVQYDILLALLESEFAQAAEDNARELRRLEARIKSLQDLLRPQGPAAISIPPPLAEEIERVIHALADEKPLIQEILGSSLPSRIINAQDYADVLVDLLQDVEDIFRSFMVQTIVLLL
jgi:trans-aconitate methyltransferase